MQTASKDSRATTSCTECQRRKQKCSREWPCNHCQARKVPHLCQFGQKKSDQKSPSAASSSESRGQKRNIGDSIDSQNGTIENSQDDVEDGLKAWGYMPGHVHYTLAPNSAEEDKRSPSSESDQHNEVEFVLHAIPPRSITDTFVNHFLSVVNYRYNAIYGPTFTDNYVQWWSDRASGKRLSPEFTCLLLRILAYSVQYLTPDMRRMIEFEMACNSQQLTDKFGNAADHLASLFAPSRSSIERVQEKFLKGAWLKSDSKIVESWHTLGATIREAQELGIDRDLGIEDLSEFDIEIRRRLWTLLYIWDWQMSAWLGRPFLINQKDHDFVLPNLRLDESASQPNLLSPFAHMALQAMLGRRISAYLGDHPLGKQLMADQVYGIQAECEAFIEELPPIFRIKDPDLSLDEQHPYYVFQRCQLHVVIYVVQLDFLKPYLTRHHKDRLTAHDDDFRKLGIDLGLKLLRVARVLFDHEFPINAKFHLVVFCIFDTATILSSAIIHDITKTLPHRQEVMDQIENALGMLHQLSATSRIGASSYNFLLKLVQASPVLSRHETISKRQRIKNSSSPPLSTSTSGLPTSLPISSAPPSAPPVPSIEAPLDTTSTVTSAPIPVAFAVATTTAPWQQQPADPFTNTLSNSTYTAMDPVPQVPITDDLNFDLEQFLLQNPFGPDAQQPDIGGMEQIWDWETLHLDGFSNPDVESSQA